ncbi:MAG: hypothetical protein ACI825_001521 [Planctomycetota bacterium]|jgi:hypothetical protein|uniref:STAS/SEC14 domain-containing protein n=1 Tax=Patiriisocius sp. Uisw_047 TaxID=3230969 RepID=UPI0039EACE22
MSSSFAFADHIVGFIISDDIDVKAIEKLHIVILDKMNEFIKVNLYLEDDNIEKFSFAAILKGIKFHTEHHGEFSKVVLVTDRKWLQMCSKLENIFLSTTIKSFKTEDRLEAMSWIAEEDKQVYL